MEREDWKSSEREIEIYITLPNQHFKNILGRREIETEAGELQYASALRRRSQGMGGEGSE